MIENINIQCDTFSLTSSDGSNGSVSEVTLSVAFGALSNSSFSLNRAKEKSDEDISWKIPNEITPPGVIEMAVPESSTKIPVSSENKRVRKWKTLCVMGRLNISHIEIFVGIVFVALLFMAAFLSPGTFQSSNMVIEDTNPSSIPSDIPSFLPTRIPSESPTSNPSSYLSFKPSTTLNPSNLPSIEPSITLIPSYHPSMSSSDLLSTIPSSSPTLSPSAHPSPSPTPKPTPSPTRGPTPPPTPNPTKYPSATPTSSPTNEFIEFYVMGDTPYTNKDAKKLSSQLKDIPRDAPFIYHLGDINSAIDTKCNETEYVKAKNILLRSKVPVFITPGDNDWNACPSPDIAWKNWNRNFHKFDANWNHTLDVRRQQRRKENVAFFIDFVLFIGINLVGGVFQDKNEWNTLLSDDIAWTLKQIDNNLHRLTSIVVFGHAGPAPRYEAYFDPLVARAKETDVPLLYLHGDGHYYDVENRAFGASHVWDVQVDRGGKAPPLKVTVTKGSRKPFEFDRRMNNGNNDG